MKEFIIAMLVWGWLVYSITQWWRYLNGMMHDAAARNNSRRHFSRPGMGAIVDAEGKLHITSYGDHRDHSERAQASLNDWYYDNRWINRWPVRWAVHTLILINVVAFAI